jgi:phage terminase small subunit
MANGHNATRAAIAAGYSPSGADVAGWVLVHQNKQVSKEIERLTELAAKKSGISATYILSSLKDVADACKAKRIEKDADGNDVERGIVDSSGANRALELLGKNLKLWVDTLDISRRGELDGVTDEELLKIVRDSTKHSNAD